MMWAFGVLVVILGLGGLYVLIKVHEMDGE